MMKKTVHLILASKSPRRREILTRLGIPFTVQTQNADESCDATDPCLFVETVARRKGEVIPCTPDTIVLSADTVVVSGQTILGKPRDAADCRRTLSMLSGNVHTVVTGFSLSGYADGRPVTVSSHTVTEVEFGIIPGDDLESYITTEEPYDKAGGYAIQGHAALWIASIRGNYDNVVGLPVFDVETLLQKSFGVSLRDFS